MTNKEISENDFEYFKNAYDKVKLPEAKPFNTSEFSLSEQLEQFDAFSHTSEESELMALEMQDASRFDAIRERMEDMGVLGMNFPNAGAPDTLGCYEKTLDILEQHKDVIDRLAGVKSCS